MRNKEIVNLLSIGLNRPWNRRNATRQHAFGPFLHEVHIARVGHDPKGSVIDGLKHLVGNIFRVNRFSRRRETLSTKCFAFHATRAIALAETNFGAHHSGAQHRRPQRHVGRHGIGEQCL